MTTLSDAPLAVPASLVEALAGDGPVLICGHARPDGDSLGSVMAMAAALRRRGRRVRTVCSDPAPAAFLAFPRMDTLEVTREVDAAGATVIVMESSALSRTGIAGLERAGAVLNIDHHLGNTAYGTINWFDEGAAACVEMVADAIDALGVPWDEEIATYLYLGLLTDTGGFRHSHISARSFDLARRCVLAGADPVRVGQIAYDSFSLGRVRLMGELLHGMRLEADGRLAVLTLTPDEHERAGSTPDETEGLINMPFTAQAIRAVCLLRNDEDGVTRVSLRSKGTIDVRAVAQQFGGGGHRNASGFTVPDPLEAVEARLLPLLLDALA
ncbi:phosphoesterase RecJ-like protein [Luteitalea sp. TBR-22]|uniref:DHH family phosphoesterase n=1 Tax=Luteitalea sp. TBR-22 TaxID=2802971 RepID=UPI001AF63133|nr:bifunctional oligoribonuclease/PAP phosphatase NrnA [Luteitalea sp. TBR-22]BCS34530.1 phosphoesterase RecJ-like protein [Luteitalea sp. TBR-22]